MHYGEQYPEHGHLINDWHRNTNHHFSLSGKSRLKRLVRLSTIGLSKGHHITRYYMYRRLSALIAAEPRYGKILCISGSSELCAMFDLNNVEITEANYPACNILELPFPDNEFDFVVSDQVLEHVEGNPQTAIGETYRVLKPGGWAIHTTCLMNPIHNHPGDFWRFTPDALKLLCGSFSRIVEVGGWGNAYLFLFFWLGIRRQPIPNASWHPLNKIAMSNSERWVNVTWIVAEK